MLYVGPTISVGMSFPVLSMFTQRRIKVDNRRFGSSSSVVHRIGSKLSIRANIANSNASR
jgi:hypothetical protein